MNKCGSLYYTKSADRKKLCFIVQAQRHFRRYNVSLTELASLEAICYSRLLRSRKSTPLSSAPSKALNDVM
jgi:hypothetical protein